MAFWSIYFRVLGAIILPSLWGPDEDSSDFSDPLNPKP